MPILYQNGQQIDHYKIIRQLSSGIGSSVYIAKDLRTQQQVILKFPIEDLIGGTDNFLIMIAFGLLAQFAHSAIR